MSKYASLPDLDQSQDTYETPDLVDDVSTIPSTIGARTSSPSFSEDYRSRGSITTAGDGLIIDHSHLRLSEARNRFEGTSLDATDVDFSDRVGSGGRRSYVASSKKSRAAARRRQRGGSRRSRSGVYYGSDGGVSGAEIGEEDGEEDEEEDEEPETLERKLARLRREVEELKAQVAEREDQEKRRKESGEEITSELKGEDEDEDVTGEGRVSNKRLRTGITDLTNVLGALQLSTSAPPLAGGSAEANLAMKIVGGLAVSASKAEPTTQPEAIPAPTGAASSSTTEAPQTPQPPAAAPQPQPLEPSYTIHYKPTFRKHHSLARAADFDSRLHVLEQILGASKSYLAHLDKQAPGNAVIPTLDDLARQISVLTSSSPPFVDALSRRVKLLSEQSEKLAEARRAARQAAIEQQAAGAKEQAAAAAAGGGAAGVGGGRRATLAGPSAAEGMSVAAVLEGTGVDGIEGGSLMSSSHDRDAKINALYGTLPTITTLSPLLPPVLDRLRSLRAIHADTGRAAEGLERIEKRQEEMAEDIASWKEALAKVEEVMGRTEGVFVGNAEQVGKWIKELEDRLERLEASE